MQLSPELKARRSALQPAQGNGGERVRVMLVCGSVAPLTTSGMVKEAATVPLNVKVLPNHIEQDISWTQPQGTLTLKSPPIHSKPEMGHGQT